jgi:hypothetical protein
MNMDHRRTTAAGLLLFAVISATVVGCSSGGEKAPATSTTSTTTSSSQTTTPSPTEKGLNPTGGNSFSPSVKAPGPQAPAPGNLPGNAPKN